MAAIDIRGLLGRMESQYDEAKKESEQRYEAGLADLAEAIGLFGPGYGAGAEQEAMAEMGQSMVGRGLAGTTRKTAGAGGIKAYFENLRKGKIAETLARTAEYQRTSPDIYPEAGDVAHLATGGYSGLLGKEQLQLQQAIAQAPGGELGPPKSGGVSAEYPSTSGGGGGGGFDDIGSPDFSLPAAQPQGNLTPQQAQYTPGYKPSKKEEEQLYSRVVTGRTPGGGYIYGIRGGGNV